MFNIEAKLIDDTKHLNDGSFLQTPFWCDFKSRHGWSYRRFEISAYLPDIFAEDENQNCECNEKKSANSGKLCTKKRYEVAVLNRNFARGMFSIAYIPLFPKLLYECTPEEIIDKTFEEKDSETEDISVISENIVTPETQSIEFAHFLTEIAYSLKPLLPKNTIVIRFDPDVSFREPDDRDFFNYGIKMVAFADRLHLKKSKVDIQPPDSTLVDLCCTEEEIFSRMHSKWRYNIRLSEKKGVLIKRYFGDDPEITQKIDNFYQLTKETNARDGNSCHAKSYYLDLIKFSAERINSGKDVPLISLYIAEHDGDAIAGIMTLFSHDEAVYLYGASSNSKRNLMPNHFLQWTAIKDAKAYGSKYYDMYGIPPEGKDENHPMHGLYMFKANFGGKNIHRTGSWDVSLKIYYIFYSLMENLRAFWFKKIIKKLKGR